MFCITCIGLFLPLISFLILMASSSFISRLLTGIIASGSLLLSFSWFVYLLYMNGQVGPSTVTLFNWIPVEGIDAKFTLRLDHLSLLMSLIITGVGFLIHVYANGYMDHDRDYARFFACMNFFVFAMLLLVLAGDILLLFVGWEGVGLASYLLIGFWYERVDAARSATKAFVVNRIGDYGFLLGLLLTFFIFRTGDIVEISQRATQDFSGGEPILLLLTFLLFVGAMGKSAQLPLHVWLPDAMAGPTPVSALIHAATMVTAGVYLVVRLSPLFLLALPTLHFVGTIGGVTALFAALCALGQTDLKRVLAYSTVSQLGYMFLACGVGAFYAAMFHLTTHAFVKALLFLAAGNVVHMMHGNTEMAKMGGLRTIFTKTHWLFLIGVLALSGVPPLAAFFSKDLILELEHIAGYDVLFYIGLLTSVLTAFYLTRAYCLTFWGTPRGDHHDVQEAPAIMLLPVAVLALLAILGGFLGFAFGTTPILQKFLGEIGITMEERELTSHFDLSPDSIIATLGALIGVISAAVLYTKYYDRVGANIAFLNKSFYIDGLYRTLFVKPFRGLARLISGVFEPFVFEGSLKSIARGTQNMAGVLQRVQNGHIRSYIAWFVIGAFFTIVYLII